MKDLMTLVEKLNINKIEIDEHHFLSCNSMVIKRLSIEEERAMKEIINVLERYELQKTDIETYQDNFSDLPETRKIITLLLLFDEYPPEILAIIDAREILSYIENNHMKFIFPMDDYIQHLKEKYEIPPTIDRYVSFLHMIKDLEMDKEVTGYKVIDRKTKIHEATFIIEKDTLEELFYNLGI